MVKTGVASAPKEGAVEWKGKRLAFYRYCLKGSCCAETEAGEGGSDVAVLGRTWGIPLEQQLPRLPSAAG